MLSQNEISKLNKCLLNDHLLLEVEVNVITRESAGLRERLNSGDILTSAELIALPYSESLMHKKITHENELQWLTAYSIANGRDLQSLFRINNVNYLTLFIDNENVNFQLKDKLKAHGLLDAFQSSGTNTITISYPEKS